MVELSDIFLAYQECRKNKRGTESAIEFELDFEANCIDLWQEVNDRSYHPSKSIAFIVTKPRRREIFAANFRDRVMHHYVDIKLRPILEEKFIEKTCNNRVGKGTSACIEYLQKDIIEASDHFKKDCWVCKMDMQGFFMSIRKSRLIGMVKTLIDSDYRGSDKDDLRWLTEVILMDHPERHCVLKSDFSAWDKLDRNKSLFWIDDDLGLPIGNLISQLFANFYLNDFDHYVTNSLGFFRYGRYVDDFYIIDQSKDKLIQSIPLIRAKLAEVEITLHPKKFYLQHYSKGVEFVGKIVKPGRTYTHNRTVYNALQSIKQYNRVENKQGVVEEFAALLNSYLGFLSTTASYNVRRNLIKAVNSEFWECMVPSEDCKKVTVYPEYKIREKIKNRLRKIKIKKHERITVAH